MPEKDKQRQPGESIFAWRRRIRNNNKFGQVSSLEGSVTTADRPDQKPTGNWFQRIRKFLHPYGTTGDMNRTYQQEELSLIHDTNDSHANLYPNQVYNTFERIMNFQPWRQRYDDLQRRTDEYRGNYASSLLPWKRNSGPNDFLSQLWRWNSRKRGYLSGQNLSFSKRGTDMISLDKNVIRVGPHTKQSTALFNEFVESKRPSVRQASEYQNGNVKSFGDLYDIPVDNVSLYAGIENGHFKLDSLNNFNPETTIYPARNIKKGMLPITRINVKDLDSDEVPEEPTKQHLLNNLWHTIDPFWFNRPHNRWNKHDYTKDPEFNTIQNERLESYQNHANKIDSLIRKGNLRQATSEMYPDSGGHTYSIGFLRDMNNYLRRAVTDDFGVTTLSYEPEWLQKQSDSLHLLKRKVAGSIYSGNGNTIRGSKYTYVDTEGNEHPISDYNASILDSKMILANPNGGMFVGKFQDMNPEQFTWLNNWLSMYPSWLLKPDLGSFSQYRTDNPTASEYLKQYYEHPDAKDPNVFIVGTTEPNEAFKKGGVIKDQNEDVVKLSRFKSKLHK